MAGIVVYVQFQNELKSITLRSAKVSELLEMSRSVFSIEESAFLKLKFTDEDGDLITITLDDELAEALNSSNESEPVLFSLESSSTSTLTLTSPTQTEAQVQTQTQTESEPPVETQTQTENQEVQQTETQTETSMEVEQQREKKIKLDEDELKEGEEEEGEEGQVGRVRRVSNIQYLANELQYHRLIVQTAVQAAFANIRSTYREKAQPVISRKIDQFNEKRDIIFEAVSTTIQEWRSNSQSFPSANDIANTVSSALKEAGHLAAPVIESIRVSIFKILDSLLRRNPLSITEAEIEMMSNSNFVEPTPVNTTGTETSPDQKETDLEMEKTMSKLDSTATGSFVEGQDIQVASNLIEEDGFLVVENYRLPDDPTAQSRERSATNASELVWEAPKEEEIPKEEEAIAMTDSFENLELTKEIIQITEMGFSDEPKIRALLVKHNGDIQSVVNELLSC